ncbi:MAG: hypothetical protein JWO58_612 [Chitinophagaceae bacterium]|nr:hypothetical protein [Chitinophagaceae bacterium]
MKKNLLLLLAALLYSAVLSAQTTGTYIVADNGNHMASCIDSTMTLADIFVQRGIKDLNDPSDNVSMYHLYQLQGSVITNQEITGPFHYSDFSTVYVEKDGGHNGGLVIFVNVLTPPTALFDIDSLKYTVARGDSINYAQDFFNHTNLWSSGLPEAPLQDRIFIQNQDTNVELPISQFPSWSNLGKGYYRIRYSVMTCSPSDLLEDTLYLKIEESLCHNIEVRNTPSVCRTEVLDITPYVFVDGHSATAGEWADMTFWDRSDVLNSTNGSVIDPTAIDISTMWNKTSLYPNIEIVYQPNVDLGAGVCQKFIYLLNTHVPTKFIFTDAVLTHDNYGYSKNYTIEGDYFGTNNLFDKTTLKKLYIDNYNVFAGSSFDFYSDNAYANVVTGNNLTPGDYYLRAINNTCSEDTSYFTIHVKNRDFDIIWQGEENLGKGYYTFDAPDYSGATYNWFVWGGSIVNGLGTDHITVYYSDKASQYVTVSCEIDFPTIRTSDTQGPLSSAVYLGDSDADGTYQEIPQETVTAVTDPSDASTLCVAYPNPAEGAFVITGNGTFDLRIYNSLGQAVYENANYTANASIQINNSKGVHVVHLTQNNRNQTLKVILK